MGLNFGGGSSQSSTNQSATQNANKTFSGSQTSLQDQLGTSLSKDLSATDSGTTSPGVTAEQTQSADAINKTSDGLAGRMQRFLAARGFGSSGESGKVQLGNELQRQSDLANNNANFAQVQQNANSTNLLAALNYALTNLGTTAASSTSGSSSGSNSTWGASASAAFAF